MHLFSPSHCTDQSFLSETRLARGALRYYEFDYLDYLTWQAPSDPLWSNLVDPGRSFDRKNLTFSQLDLVLFHYYSPRELRREPKSRKRRRSSITDPPPPPQARTLRTSSACATSRLRSITLSFTLPICPAEKPTPASPEA